MKGGRTLFAITASLLLLGACGQPTAEDNAAYDAIQLAADKAADAGSQRMVVSVTMSGVPFAGEYTSVGRGAFDSEKQIGKMTMSMTGLPGMGATQMEMIMDGLTAYFRWPHLTSMMGSDATWVEMDLQSMGEDAGFDFDALMQAGQNDPSQSLAYLRGASESVELLGEEEIRGLRTTHYSADVDLNKVVENAPPDVRERVAASISSLEAMVDISSMPVEVWIDEEGLPRRMAYSYDMTMPGAEEPVSTEMMIDIIKYGVKVNAEPPPPGSTVTFDELIDSTSSL